MSEHSTYALTFVSKDRPGIVADVTKVLYKNGFNIADSSSTLLQGIFSMILLVQHDNMTTAKIESLFAGDGTTLSVYEVENNVAAQSAPAENFIISVYGADKPGIVHHITAKLFEKNINIVDLQTQVAGKPPKEAYIMILEVIVPVSAGEDWVTELKNTAQEIGTDITIRRLETYEL